MISHIFILETIAPSIQTSNTLNTKQTKAWLWHGWLFTYLPDQGSVCLRVFLVLGQYVCLFAQLTNLHHSMSMTISTLESERSAAVVGGWNESKNSDNCLSNIRVSFTIHNEEGSDSISDRCLSSIRVRIFKPRDHWTIQQLKKCIKLLKCT